LGSRLKGEKRAVSQPREAKGIEVTVVRIRLTDMGLSENVGLIFPMK